MGGTDAGIYFEQASLEPFPQIFQADAVFAQHRGGVVAARFGRLLEPSLLEVRRAVLQARGQHGLTEVFRLGRLVDIGVSPFQFQHPDGGQAQELFNGFFRFLGIWRRHGLRRRVSGCRRGQRARQQDHGNQRDTENAHGFIMTGPFSGGEQIHSAVTVTSKGREETGN